MKILICDDDISMIRVIETQINWESLGISKVLRAYNGAVAKEIIQEERPNLILCDIEMPQCNGISVLKFVYENQIPAEFVFLTCAESFEFAREAIRYGASNYLTKPLDLEELYATLQNMVAAVRKRLNEQDREADRRQSESAKINHIFQNLKDGLYSTDCVQIDHMLSREGYSFRADSMWRIICVSSDTRTSIRDGWDDGSVRYTIRRLAQEVIADRMDFSYLLVDSGERFEYLLLFLDASSLSEGELERRCHQMIQISKTQLGIAQTCLIGEPSPLYLTAKLAPQMRKTAKTLRLDYGKVYLHRDLQREQFVERGNDSDTELDVKKLLYCLKLQRIAAFIELVSAGVTAILKDRHQTAEKIALLHHDLLQTVYTYLRDNDIQARVLFRGGLMQELNDNAERSQADMVEFASYLFDQASAALSLTNGSSDIISHVKRYIAEHFREDIDRDDIAAIVFITPNYLSKRFRLETGMGLREYINQMRIEDAKRLMLTTNMSISTIAAEVGFENISYFSTVFRRLCGISPVEWREQ